MILEDFQTAMSQYVFKREGSDSVNTYIKVYTNEEALARLSIYQNNTFYSLSEVLKDTYPTVLETIGEDLFKQIAKAYLQEHPPQSAALVDLGQDFPTFIPDMPVYQELAYLKDLATLDLYHHLSYHAKDIESVAAESFAQLAIETLISAKIIPIASVHILASDFAIFDMWQLVHGEEKESQCIDADKAQYILVIRPEAEVNLYNLDFGTYTFLNTLLSGSNINDALLLAQDSDKTFNPSNAISFLIQSGFSARIIEE